MPRGKLIVIDGGDATGKTEQTRLLVERMKKEGRPVETVSFPRYDTPTGRVVKAYLDGAYGDPLQVEPQHASMLYAVDRWAALRTGAFDGLTRGVHLVANRYVASNMGHQGAKFHDAEARMAFFRWNDEMEHDDLDLPRPDLNVILHMPAEVSMRLLAGRGNVPDGHENLEHLKRAEATYLEIARSYPNCVLVECMRPGAPPAVEGLLPPEDIHELVWEQVRAVL